MVLLEEELWGLSLTGDGSHPAVALEVDTTLTAEDGLVRSSVVPVGGGLGEAMATGVETAKEGERWSVMITERDHCKQYP